MHKLLFFASGSGSNFQAVIDSIEEGSLNASICGLITDNSEAGAIHRARNHSIPVYTVKPINHEQFTEELLSILSELSPDLIVLAGYLKKIPDQVINLYSGKIINIHPSLLPKYGGKGFYGLNVHRAVLQNSESWSGCTVHYVDEVYDNGTIIAQKKVPVATDDSPETLAKKVLAEEHELLTKTINQILTKKTDF